MRHAGLGKNEGRGAGILVSDLFLAVRSPVLIVLRIKAVR